MIERVRARGLPRVRVPSPMMDQGAKRWLLKYSYKNHWRIGKHYDYLDLIQDGYLCYYMVRNRYPDAVDPPHIMRLFQVTFINHVHDLSKAQSRMAAIVDHAADLDTAETYMPGALAEQGDSYIIPQSAPWFVHAFLRLMCTEDGLAHLRAEYRVRLSGIRECTHDKLCRLIGADPELTPTLPDALERYFASV